MAAIKNKSVTNEEILTEVMNIHLKITEIQLLEARRVEREKITNDLVYGLDRAINGNGKPGLKSDTQQNTHNIHALQENFKRINALGAVFTAAIIADIISRIYSR